MATLDGGIEAILDSFVDAVEAEAAPDGLLPTVRSVVRGDKARPMPELPAVWIVPQEATFVQEDYGQETWELPVSIAAVVKDDDVENAARYSQRIVVRARAACLAMRDVINLGSDGYFITDIRSQSFDPTARTSEQNRTLHWTEAVVHVSFSISEEPTTPV